MATLLDFASRLELADGRRLFVKAVDAQRWPMNGYLHRTEATVAAALPATVPAPPLLGFDDGNRWVVLAFEDVDGREPRQPWTVPELDRVIAAVNRISTAANPAPISLPSEHPRLGGWTELASDPIRSNRLTCHSVWAAGCLSQLIELETEGCAAARGDALVHFDRYPHNILLTPAEVVIVDWPHARLGAPIIDLITVLSSAAADRIDPEPILRGQPLTADHRPHTIDAVLAAHTGFCLAGGLQDPTPGLEPITRTKLRIGLGALAWLQRRLTRARG